MTNFRVLALCALLCGCGPRAPLQGDLDDIASQLAYIKDQHGICYAVISTLTYSGYRVASISAVPCDKVGL